MDYRVYIVGSDEHFIGVREIDAPDDKAALRKAKRYVDGQDVEVWQRERRIGRIASNERTKSQNPVVQLALRRLSQRGERGELTQGYPLAAPSPKGLQQAQDGQRARRRTACAFATNIRGGMPAINTGDHARAKQRP
jgi:hypothetical protein